MPVAAQLGHHPHASASRAPVRSGSSAHRWRSAPARSAPRAYGAAAANATVPLSAQNWVPSVYSPGGSSTCAVARSPSTNANTSTPAAASPGRASGSVTRHSVRSGPSPSDRADSSSAGLDQPEGRSQRHDREGHEQHRLGEHEQPTVPSRNPVRCGWRRTRARSPRPGPGARTTGRRALERRHERAAVADREDRDRQCEQQRHERRGDPEQDGGQGRGPQPAVAAGSRAPAVLLRANQWVSMPERDPEADRDQRRQPGERRQSRAPELVAARRAPRSVADRV